MVTIGKERIQRFQHMIMDRYATHKRQLPRRDVFDPYRVLVSEIMLQQTQVDRVIPKYIQFIETLPDFSALQHASKTTVLGLRSGLGFNSRVLRLQMCADEIMKQYDGVLPRSREELLKLPGIGPYTSCSLLAFAYNMPVPVIDTNVRRVLIAGLDLDTSLGVKELEQIALVCIPEGKSNDRHNALMDYGSAVFTVKQTGIKPLSKQSSFVGSRRQIRGKVLKHLLTHGPTEKSILMALYPHPEWQSILDEMCTEHLIRQQDTLVSIE